MLNLTQLSGFGGKSGGASLTAHGSWTGGFSSKSSVTVSACDIGPSPAQRRIIAIGRAGSGNLSVSGVTVGGVTASQLIYREIGGYVLGVYVTDQNIEGATADVVVAFSTADTAADAAVIRAFAPGCVPQKSWEFSGASTGVSFTTPTDGAAIVAFAGNAGTSCSTSNINLGVSYSTGGSPNFGVRIMHSSGVPTSHSASWTLTYQSCALVFV